MILLRPAVLIAFILFLCFPQRYCAAQDKSKIQFVKPGPGDFQRSDAGDSSSAVILSDYGSVYFIGNEKGWFSHVFQRHTRIRIINKKAFDLATVSIRLNTNNDDAEKADHITATTYNNENGVVTESQLDKKDIFSDRKDKNHIEMRFTLPAVKEGSIIEYAYSVTSDYNYFPGWEFQSIEYPCLYSEFEVEIPQTLVYVFVKQGIHSFAVDKGSQGRGSYRVGQKNNTGLVTTSNDLYVNANTVKHRWVMKDIPAFRAEKYISTPRNYLDKIEFQQSSWYDGQEYHDVTNNWKKATEELLKREDFGRPLYENTEWLDEWLNKITANISDPLLQAKAIYYYLQEHLTCTSYYDKFIRTNLRDVLKKNSGTVGDLNLLLLAMLRQKGFTADPVLLSTREFGFNLAKYPIMERLNYVVGRLKLRDTVYYLDIAHPQLGFGQLASGCYNGHARIISDRDSGSVYFEADSLREKRTTMVFISNGEKGLEGSYQALFGPVESYRVRERVSEIGEKEYFKRIRTSYGEDADISHTHIDSLDKKEEPVTVRYEIDLKQSGASMIYLTPFFGDVLRENPFKAADRKYPVEMPYAADQLYLFNMEVPAGYVVEELPKSARVAFNGDQGSFEYLVAHQDNMIQLRCRLKLNRAYFSPDDYASLRDFYAFIVRKEAEQIVLKKQ
ncbi:MAG: DUF3857 domain-containing protein [Chitinophagaceae bacterium]|nr:DUF3857 domain-containing protein [Chitinophagaceae bacterium]